MFRVSQKGGPGDPGGPGGPGDPGCLCGPGGQGGPCDQFCQGIWFKWSKQSDYQENLRCHTCDTQLEKSCTSCPNWGKGGR